MISAALRGEEQAWRDLKKVPAWIDEVLKQDAAIARMAERFRYMHQCVYWDVVLTTPPPLSGRSR